VSDTPKRFQVMAAWPDGRPENVGEADCPTQANRIAIAAFLEGAVQVDQYDTAEPPPAPTTEEERANLAAIIPVNRVRNFE
jgi:hypothetical protein